MVVIERLTNKQRIFVENYLTSGDTTKSAILAGYSEKTASRVGKSLIEKENIKNYIASKVDEYENSKIAKEEEILEYLSCILRSGDNNFQKVSKGNSLKKYDEKERMKAAELLGKRYGIFKEVVNSNKTPKVIIYGEGDLPE